MVREAAEAQVPDEQRTQRGTRGEGRLQGTVEARPARIIPASTFDASIWKTGENIRRQFKRADGDPWGLAGL
ncbi:MAG: hypothetical protein ACRYGA_05840 [Janthinobacterium lividum]